MPQNNKNSKIVFWGTPEFALPALEALIENGYNIAAVITNPDKPAGRKNIITPPLTKVWARKHKIDVLQPHTLVNFKFQISNFKPDLFIVAAYGKIIPKEILDLPKYDSLNIHPSLLPRWRGPSPIQYTILNGDTETGVTIIKMDEKMDHGPIVAQRRLEIRNPKSEIRKWTYKILHDELAKLGAELLIETLPKWLAGKIKPMPQNEAEATYSKILKKDDGRIDWSWPAEKIEKLVRAFTPWPGVWTTWPQDEAPRASPWYLYTHGQAHGLDRGAKSRTEDHHSSMGKPVVFWCADKKNLRLRIEGADVIKQEPAESATGYVWQNQDYPLLVKTSQGSLAIKKLTLEGKKTMRAEDFLRGYPQIVGQTLF